MATKAAMANGDSQPFKKPRFVEGALGKWSEFTGFLRDVRGEMHKVVAPGRKEVQSTTSVVIIAVFIFGLFFFIVDNVFKFAVYGLLGRLGGLQ
jgi:preprotein translocase subunit SecE